MSAVTLALLILAALVALMRAMVLGMRRRARGPSARLSAGAAGLCLALSAVADQVAQGSRRALDWSLRIESRRSIPAVRRPGPDESQLVTALPLPVASSSTWPGVTVIARLLYLAVAVCILVGEYTINLLRVPAVQYHIEGGSAPLLALDVTSGLLWIAVAALYGMLLLEFLDVVPPSARLFPFLPQRARRIFAGVAFAGFILTVLAVGLLYAAGQLLVEGYTWPQAAVVLSPLQGILLTTVSVVAFWALVPGSLALVSVACTVSWLLWSALAQAFSAVATGLEPEPMAGGSSDEGVVAREHLLARGSSNTDQSEEIRMAERNTSIVGFGAAGRRLVPLLLSTLDELGASGMLAAYGICYADRMSEAPTSAARRGGASDISTTQDEIQAALMAAGPEGARALVRHAFVDQLVEVNDPSALGEGQIVVACDLREVCAIASGLHQLSQRHPQHTLLLFAAWPEPGQEDEQLSEALRQVKALHADGVMTQCILIHPRSLLARCDGADRQEELAVRGIASLLRAPADDSHNPTLGELVSLTGRFSPFAALAVGSVCIASGPPVRGYDRLRRIFRTWPVRGHGNLVDARNQAKALTERLLQDEQARTLAAPLDATQAPLVLAYSLPLHPRDKRRPLLTADLSTWLIQRFPAVRPVFVCGNGTPDQRMASGTVADTHRGRTPYYLQTTCVFPVYLRVPWSTDARETTQREPS